LIYLVPGVLFAAALAWLIFYVPALECIRTPMKVVLGLIVVGMALWLINMYVPMAGSIKAILNIVVVVATCVGVLQAFGLWTRTVALWRNFWSHRKAANAPDTVEVHESHV